MTAEDRNAIKGKIEKLLPLIDELDKDWVADWNDETQEKYFVVLMHEVNVCFVSADRTRQRIGSIYMSESTAKIIKDKINKTLTRTIRNGSGDIISK